MEKNQKMNTIIRASKRETPYVMIENDILNANLSLSEKMTLIVIQALEQKKETLSIERIATMASLTNLQVEKALDGLVQEGWVERGADR